MSIRALSPELAEKARLELNEDSNRLQSDIQHIKDWLSKQPHLRARTDDQFIVAFLRGCKFSLERTKEKIDLYYSLRSLAPELFSIQPKDARFKEIMSLGAYVILPNSCASDKTRITLLRLGRLDTNKFSLIDMLAAANHLEKITLVNDDESMIHGRRTIIDLEGVTMAHYVQMTPTTMKKMIVFGQDAAPMRMKGAHYINLPPGFDVVFNAMRSLLNEKNRNRLLVHNKNYDEMYTYIPKDTLPAEYGGNAGTVDQIVDYWMKKVNDFSSWLEEDIKYGSDEAKRPGKPNTAAELFGVDGSFRQLEFD
ncbi:clavesin-2-like [Zerene cesonia]|uniref:clavesin-2-like n=1 Tax=Zerene cesonia TaxID=33412 RepID=UPI0018E4DE03|nr:clavesin-2-like [Zerene cesonia]